jgi:tetratricopeptide (TPR) repeat protein
MMRTLTIFIALILFKGVSGQPDYDNYLKAKSLIQTEKYDSALYYMELAMEKHPENIDIVYHRGLCNFHLKRYDHAVTDFLFVNKRKSGMGSLMLAKTEARLNHNELAVKYLREHLSSHYKLPEKEILLDQDFTGLESSMAWKSLWKEREWYTPLDQELQDILHMKSRGDYLEVINRLNDLDQKRYKRSIVNLYLAETYLALENLKAAAEALDKSISSDTRNMEALKLRRDLHILKGDFEKAGKDCDRLLRQSPDEFEYYLISGRINSRVGEYKKALESVKFYIRFYPNSDKAYSELGLIHYNNGQYLEALKSFNMALSIYEGNAAYFFNRGRAYAATKTYNYAVRDFSMALDLDPADPEIWYNKGLADLELGNRNSACFSFNKAFQLGKFEASEYVQRICN